MNKNLFEKICIFMLLLGASFSICYWAIAKYNLTEDYRACGRDAENYIKMSKMQYTDVPKPYRYRVVMPSMVYLLNRYLNIDNFLSQYYEDVESKKMQLNFGIVNILALTCTAFLLYYYCQGFGLSKPESLLGAFFYLTSFFVVTYYTVPLVDSLSAFFILACFYALFNDSLAMLGIYFLLGVFTKEATFLVIPLIMLAKKKIFSKELLVCLPGVFFYIILVTAFKSPLGDNVFSIISDPSRLKMFLSTYVTNLSLYGLIEAIQTFMFLWVLALISIFKCRIPAFLKRSLWLFLLPVLTAPVVGLPFVGRVTFYLFPIIIPLSLFALRDIFAKENAPAA